jgi:hypothetical protein
MLLFDHRFVVVVVLFEVTHIPSLMSVVVHLLSQNQVHYGCKEDACIFTQDKRFSVYATLLSSPMNKQQKSLGPTEFEAVV